MRGIHEAMRLTGENDTQLIIDTGIFEPPENRKRKEEVMTTVFTETGIQEFTVKICGGCGVKYAMTTELYDRRLEDHKSFWCPNGCCRSFTGGNETTKLRQQLEAERNRSSNLLAAKQAAEEQAKHERRERQKMKTRHTNLRLRVKLGTCPCCSHQFENLKTHMATAHPNFTPTEDHKIL